MKRNRLLLILCIIAAMSTIPVTTFAQNPDAGVNEQESSICFAAEQNAAAQNPDPQIPNDPNEDARSSDQSDKTVSDAEKPDADPNELGEDPILEEEESPFEDVKTANWFYSSVMKAVEMGLINGIDASRYMPDTNLTYAQAIKLAACMNQKYTTGEVMLKNGSPHWYDSYVEYCQETGIITENYESVIDETIDRQTYAGIFAKCLPQEGLSERNRIPNGSIPDVPAGNENYDGIYTLYRAGILNGRDKKGSFDPCSNIKRSEVAAIVDRMMDETARVDAPAGLVTPSQGYDIQEGDFLSFGAFEQDHNFFNGKEEIEWIVLKIENGKALLLSKYGLDSRKYNETEGYVTWENCTLRTWLNETFLAEAFSDTEQGCILETTVKNPDTFVGFDSEKNPVRSNVREEIAELQYHAAGGKDTIDKVFLLSIDEAKELLGDEPETLMSTSGVSYTGYPDRQTTVTKYAKAQKCFTSSYYVTPEGGACWWWLRSPGCFNDAASLIDEYGHTYSDSVYHGGTAVRPAVWISLAPTNVH